MDHSNLSTYTVIYTCDNALPLMHEVKQFPVSKGERVVIPRAFKDGKIIIAVIQGDVPVLSKLGDRIFAIDHPTETLEL